MIMTVIVFRLEVDATSLSHRVFVTFNFPVFIAFYCDCDAGWEQNHDTGACTTRTCDGTQCMHEQSCSTDSLECVCEAGLSGDNCELSN